MNKFEASMQQAMEDARCLLEREGELLGRISAIKCAVTDLIRAVEQNRYATTAEKLAAKELAEVLK